MESKFFILSKSKILLSHRTKNYSGGMAYYDCLIHNDKYLSTQKYLNIFFSGEKINSEDGVII
jgi:hypothetical protein